MDWSQTFTTSTLTIVLLFLIGFIGRKWLETQITEKIKSGYEKEIEKYKEQVRWEAAKKEKAAAVVEVFSLWVASNYDKDSDKNLFRYELQKKYWELSLWLDAPILKVVNDALTASGPTIKHKEAMSSVRKMILDDPDDPISAENWIHWNALDRPAPSQQADE